MDALHSQRRRGRDPEMKRTNLIEESACATRPRLEGGKGKWRTKVRERWSGIAYVCEVSCGCPFADPSTEWTAWYMSVYEGVCRVHSDVVVSPVPCFLTSIYTIAGATGG